MLDLDFNFWAYVGIYTGIYTLLAFIIALLSGLGALSVLIYLLINAILYFIVGMGVIWCIREFKDGADDGKLAIGIGVVVQIVLTNVINSIVGAIF